MKKTKRSPRATTLPKLPRRRMPRSRRRRLVGRGVWCNAVTFPVGLFRDGLQLEDVVLGRPDDVLVCHQ
jgi:hypothetical protein